MTEPYQLFQRTGSNKWWVRFSIKGEGQIRKSLNTINQDEAAVLGRKAYYEAIYRIENGLRATKQTFTNVAEEFIEKIIREVERGERKKEQGEKFPGVIRRYFIGYFGDKAIDSITDRDVDAYTKAPKN